MSHLTLHNLCMWHSFVK